MLQKDTAFSSSTTAMTVTSCAVGLASPRATDFSIRASQAAVAHSHPPHQERALWHLRSVHWKSASSLADVPRIRLPHHRIRSRRRRQGHRQGHGLLCKNLEGASERSCSLTNTANKKMSR